MRLPPHKRHRPAPPFSAPRSAIRSSASPLRGRRSGPTPSPATSYGGGAADLAPCLGMIGVSLGTGVARIMGDRHWASDVLAGWTVGALSGYVLPSVLHYGFGGGRPIGEMRVGGAHVVPTPLAYAG